MKPPTRLPAGRVLRLEPSPDPASRPATAPPPQPDAGGRPAERPWVLVNMALTADGKIATANRRVHTFGSRRDLDNLYALRATADAVMCGARTVGPAVTLGTGGEKYRRLRLRRGLAEHALRVVVSGAASLDPALPLFARRFSPVLVLTTRRAPAARLRRLAAVAAEIMVAGEREVDLPAALAHLVRAWRVRRLLCEGGGELNDALFRADLVDELHLTFCPLVFGGRDAPTLAEGQGLPRLAGARRFRLTRMRRVGDELFCVFARARDETPPGTAQEAPGGF